MWSLRGVGRMLRVKFWQVYRLFNFLLIVVALVMGEEATLKRLRRKGASIALEAANPAYETRIFGPDQVAVQGKLVGLIRAYH